MKKTRRAKLTVETQRLLVVGRGSSSSRGGGQSWCEACRAEVRMLRVEEAALVSGLSQRAIFRRTESGRLHFAETSRGVLLICADSLLKERRDGSEERPHEIED